MSQVYVGNGSGGGGGSGITTINGDVGSITGSTVTIFANNSSNGAGATVLFNNSGTISTLLLSDSLSNLSLGQGANANSSTASNCTAVGVDALTSINLSSFNSAFGNGALSNYQGNNLSGGNNCAFGAACLDNLVDGNQNCAMGSACGVNYTGSESSNILIESDGVTGESHVTRIGRQGSGSGQQNECFIAGIVGNTVSNAEFVTVNSSTGQLGVSSFTPITPTYFSAYLSAPTSGVTGDGTNYGPIVFNTILSNVGSSYNNSTGIFTAPATGFYCFQSSVTFNGSDPAVTQYIVFWNGSVYGGRSFQLEPLAGGGTIVLSATVAIPMTAGDTMAVNALASGSASKNVTIYGSTPGVGAVPTIFSGFRVA